MAAVELEITNVAHGGVFVARHEGRVVFVSDAIPGERVLARISDETHTSFWRAETLAVLTASPHRRPHVWTAASIDRAPEDRAGGAEFGHIALAYQRELKRQVLTDALSRMAGISSDVTVAAVAGDDEADGLGWRTRVRLHVGADGIPGPYAARSHRVIRVDDLPLATAAVSAALAEAAPLDRPLPGAESVDVIAPGTGPAQVLVTGAAKNGTAKTGAAKTGAAKNGAAKRGTRSGTRRNVIRERVAGREFQLDAAGFWQVHRDAPQTLFAAVQQAVDGARFDPDAANLDLYGGVGLLAASLADRFGRRTRVTSVESNDRATSFAARNLSEWTGASAVTDRVDRYLRRVARDAGAAERSRLAAGTVVLDPPRSGAGKQVVEQLAGLHSAQIVYVACDPVSLARDVASFARRGYQLKSLTAFDLFPHTHHLEAVALLVPAP